MGLEEMAQKSRALSSLSEGPGLVASPRDDSQPSATPVPGDMVPSSGLSCHCKYVVHIHVGKTLTHINKDKIERKKET